MISEKEAKIIAGQMLIERYGKEYFEQNINRLSILVGREKGKLQIDFELHKQDLDKIPSVEKNGGIYVEEKNFPDIILSVEVDLRDSSAKIIED